MYEGVTFSFPGFCLFHRRSVDSLKNTPTKNRFTGYPKTYYFVGSHTGRCDGRIDRRITPRIRFDVLLRFFSHKAVLYCVLLKKNHPLNIRSFSREFAPNLLYFVLCDSPLQLQNLRPVASFSACSDFDGVLRVLSRLAILRREWGARRSILRHILRVLSRAVRTDLLGLLRDARFYGGK